MGDKTSIFFHLLDSFSNWKNFISSIIIDGNVITTPSKIKSQVANFFSNMFNTGIVARLYMGSTCFKSLSIDSFIWLKRKITLEEVKKVMWIYKWSKTL